MPLRVTLGRVGTSAWRSCRRGVSLVLPTAHVGDPGRNRRQIDPFGAIDRVTALTAAWRTHSSSMTGGRQEPNPNCATRRERAQSRMYPVGNPGGRRTRVKIWFKVTYRQLKPNPHHALRRDDGYLAGMFLPRRTSTVRGKSWKS